MTVTIQSTDLYVHNLRTRMPFRYGIATMKALPHLFVRLTCHIDGQIQTGLAADSLPPKWFTKNPNTHFRDDVADMLRVIKAAASLAQEVEGTGTVFELWQELYTRQKRWAEAEGYPPLLWNFGVSLIERAVIDAFCRLTETPLAEALRSNTLGISLGEIHGPLAGYNPADLLPPQPQRSLIVRHTVGLVDPLTGAEITAAERVEDGLPQSLESCVSAYGLTHFKIKVGSDQARDMARLKQIAAVLDAGEVSEFAFTLDGNEQYKNVSAFREFWQGITNDVSLASFMSRLLFVEQPLPRDVALSAETQAALNDWPDRPPIIIDESDGSLDSLPAALECGYAGTSHKNCKGIFKGLANGCLLEYQRRSDPEGLYILSGEDLANVGPVALLQDLAMMANLGLEHVERNGHHYFAGLSMFPPQVQAEVLSHQPALYRRHERGFATLNIEEGTIAVDRVIEAPFGVGFECDLTQITPLESWSFDSLEDHY